VNAVSAPVAIVIGGGTGVGRRCALSMASSGFSVVVHLGEGSGDRSGADYVVQEIRNSGGRAEPDYNDLTTFSGAEALVDHTTNVF
jgi:NAD(P)-dependent dehydrogenase (short-subunit alcohol dehydrogenase family)